MPDLTWTRNELKTHKTPDGRFTIYYNPTEQVKRGRWIVWDNNRIDPVQGCHFYYKTTTLGHAKRVAARWAKQHPTV
jgi:hypothetical protein